MMARHGLDPALFARERLGFEADEAQIRVLDPTIHRGVLNCTRQWGKSTVSAVKAVHKAFWYPETNVVIASPSERQTGEFLWKARRFVQKLGITPRSDGTNPLSVMLPNGSRIIGLPDVANTSRGFSAVSLLLVDEASRVREETIHALTPMLARGGGAAGGQMWLMSSPYGKRGYFWKAWRSPRWTKVCVPATECPRISAAFLEEQRESMGDRLFRQEYLCEFVEADDAVFADEDIEAAIDQEVPGLWEER